MKKKPKKDPKSMIAPILGLIQPSPAPELPAMTPAPEPPISPPQCPRCHASAFTLCNVKTLQLDDRVLLWTKRQCECGKVWIDRTEK